MPKLAEAGLIWISDSEIYVADKSLYSTPVDFLRAVLAHIKKLIDDYSETECGWCRMPEFNKYLIRVTISYMIHRINSEWHDSPFWELIEEPGRGHREVWLIDFGD